jgi:hypothetical protein
VVKQFTWRRRQQLRDNAVERLQGQQQGAKYALANSRVRKTVERDEQDRIVAVIEDRVPASPEPTGKQPVGFHRRPRQ